MNLLFQNNQFKSSLRSYKPQPKSKKQRPKKANKSKQIKTVLNPVKESEKVIDLNDGRFDLTNVPSFVKKAPGGSTSKIYFLNNK